MQLPLIRFIVQDENPSLEMKNFLVLSVLLLLITFIGLICSSKDVKQACEGRKDVLLCGDVCLKDGKNCTCGNSSFTVKRFEPKSTEVCCSPEGRCFKDTNGKYLFKYGDVYTFFKKYFYVQEMGIAVMERSKNKKLSAMDSVL